MGSGARHLRQKRYPGARKETVSEDISIADCNIELEAYSAGRGGKSAHTAPR